MIKVGWNYGNKLKCPICQIGDDTQNHLFQCKELNNESHSRSSKHDFDSDSDSADNNNNNNNNNNKNINEPNNNNINLPKHMLMRLETVLRKREVIIEQREKSQKQNWRCNTVSDNATNISDDREPGAPWLACVLLTGTIFMV